MIAWWMAQVALLGGLLALAAYGAESALTVLRRPTRWVWAAALGLTALLGALAPMQRRAPATSAPDWLREATTTASTPDLTTRDVFNTIIATCSMAWRDVTTQLSALAQRAGSEWNAAMPDTIGRWMLLAWLAASVALLIAFVAVHVRYQRRRAQWPIGDVLGTRVRIADDTGPAVIGVTSAEIVVPQWLLTRDTLEQRLVIEHELEHVRQHDPMLLAAAQVIVVLLPWLPAVWWMVSRLRLAIELDCDRRVLQRGASARDYGALLIDLTGHRSGFGAALPAFSCTPSHLERRLIAMTPTRLKYPVVRALTTAAFASLALLAACEAKLPTSEEVETMTAATAVKGVLGESAVGSNDVKYFVDSVRVSAAAAKAIAADRIAAVHVSNRGAPGGGEVHITTRVAANAAPTGATTVPDTANLAYYVDGVRVSKEAASRIRREDIMAETARGNNAAPNEVRITTRAGANLVKAGEPSSIRVDGDRAARMIRYATRDSSGKVIENNIFSGLMVVDGVIVDPAIVNRMTPDQIVSVNIIKGGAATALYPDPRAINGVIEITTKKAKP